MLAKKKNFARSFFGGFSAGNGFSTFWDTRPLSRFFGTGPDPFSFFAGRFPRDWFLPVARCWAPGQWKEKLLFPGPFQPTLLPPVSMGKRVVSWHGAGFFLSLFPSCELFEPFLSNLPVERPHLVGLTKKGKLETLTEGTVLASGKREPPREPKNAPGDKGFFLPIQLTNLGRPLETHPTRVTKSSYKKNEPKQSLACEL